MFHQTGNMFVHVKLVPSLRTERRVCGDRNAEVLAKGDKLLLGQVRVDLDLVDSWLDASVAQNVDEQ